MASWSTIQRTNTPLTRVSSCPWIPSHIFWNSLIVWQSLCSNFTGVVYEHHLQYWWKILVWNSKYYFVSEDCYYSPVCLSCTSQKEVHVSPQFWIGIKRWPFLRVLKLMIRFSDSVPTEVVTSLSSPERLTSIVYFPELLHCFPL